MGNVSSVEHTLEFSNQGQMNLGYLFTNSYASLFQGHSWNFTSQALTLQSPENILRQKSVGNQKLCVKELSAGDLQGGWDTSRLDGTTSVTTTKGKLSVQCQCRVKLLL